MRYTTRPPAAACSSVNSCSWATIQLFSLTAVPAQVAFEDGSAANPITMVLSRLTIMTPPITGFQRPLPTEPAAEDHSRERFVGKQDRTPCAEVYKGIIPSSRTAFISGLTSQRK